MSVWMLWVGLVWAQDTPITEGSVAEPPTPVDTPADDTDVAASQATLVPTDDLDAPPWAHAAPLEPILHEVGDRPRRRLRLRATDDDAWQMQVSRAHTVVIGEDRQEGVRSVLTADVSHNGTQVQVRPTDLDLVGVPAPALAQARDQARSLASDAPPTGRIDPQQRARVDADPTGLDPVPSELLADLVWTLQATAVPLPEDRIGPGARWSWTVTAAEGAIEVAQTWTATLQALSRHEIVVDVSLQATADGDLRDAQLSAEGRIWQRLDRPLPRAADLTLTAQMSLPAPSSDEEDPDGGRPAGPTPAAMEARITVVTREVPAPGPADG